VSVDATKTVVHAFHLVAFRLTSPTSCFGAYRPYRMLQHTWSLAPVGVTTSPLSCSNYTGYQYDSEWNLSSLSWSTRRSTAWHHRICQTIPSSLPPPGAVSFDHQTISSALLLWPPYGIGQAIIFLPCGFFYLLSSFFLAYNLSRRRLHVYHTSTHRVALAQI